MKLPPHAASPYALAMMRGLRVTWPAMSVTSGSSAGRYLQVPSSASPAVLTTQHCSAATCICTASCSCPPVHCCCTVTDMAKLGEDTTGSIYCDSECRGLAHSTKTNPQVTDACALTNPLEASRAKSAIIGHASALCAGYYAGTDMGKRG